MTLEPNVDRFDSVPLMPQLMVNWPRNSKLRAIPHCLYSPRVEKHPRKQSNMKEHELPKRSRNSHWNYYMIDWLPKQDHNQPSYGHVIKGHLNTISQLNDESSVVKFVSTSQPKVIAFTDKKLTPTLIKAMSITYEGNITFGVIRGGKQHTNMVSILSLPLSLTLSCYVLDSGLNDLV